MIGNRIDPIKTSENIRETYLRYLTTAFGLKNSELARQFSRSARESEGLFRGPILEATPNYRKGKSLLEFITEPNSILSEAFGNYAPGLNKDKIERCLPMSRPLYTHQEKALKKIVGSNRNIVVATGTGSGKTECFLLPIIDYLLKERSANRLGPGVRAMLLYPMNALANDQVARLRTLLPPETGITFGRYTGQTPQSYYQGNLAFSKENNGATSQPNELFCRDQILGIEPEAKHWPHKKEDLFLGPPHILLTNFAMLEYLLMRPMDSALFDGDAGKTWRFIVLDEAHVYTGAMGTEIGYLMRRLKDRVCRSAQGKLLCIATSATVGATDKKSRKTITDSFQNLFGEPFEEEDLITGDIIPSEEALDGFIPWGNGSASFYNAIEQIIGGTYSSIEKFKKIISNTIYQRNQKTDSGWPNLNTLKLAIEKAIRGETVKEAQNIFLFYLLAGDCNVRDLINRLEQGPIDMAMPISKKNESLIPATESKEMQKYLIRLVNLASYARLSGETAPLLAARYHFFVRSLEGISVQLIQLDDKGNLILKPRIILGRHRRLANDPKGEFVAFELQACGRCGHSFLHGYMTIDGRFQSYYQRKRLEDKKQKDVYLSIDLEKIVESAEDEEPLRDEKPPTAEKETAQISRTLLGDAEYLCARCGYITRDNQHSCKFCRNNHELTCNDWVEVRRLFSENGRAIKVCPACGARKTYGRSIIRPFSPGDDAAGAVLAQALMVKIPSTSEKPSTIVKEESEPKGRFAALNKFVKQESRGGKQRLLAFSDSRQDAAYFATYLNRTGNQILHRQLILKAIRKIADENPGITAFGPHSIITPLKEQAQAVGLFGASMDDIQKTSIVSMWINAELIGIQRRYGLEGVGLISWELGCRQTLFEETEAFNEGLVQDFGLTSKEFVLLLELFLTELRRQNVLQPLKNVNIQDLYFWPRNRPYSIRKNHVHKPLSIASWLPQASRNMRSDFIERLFLKMGRKCDKQIMEALLGDLWELSINIPDNNIWEKVDRVNALWGGRGNDGIVFRVKWDAWHCRPNLKDNAHTLYKCDTCGNLSSINLKAVCPSYRCPGELTPIDPNIEFAENHYRYLYEGLPTPITAQEHTAQITTQEGAERQRHFSDDEKPLNVLSCSTTFELGVDVGELHAVFLRNVPPTVANYIQRSGRAGRRLSAAAYVLTFCRSRPHDLGYFDSAERLIQGKIQPTVIKTDNIRIARRHLHAAVLSHFWRYQYPHLFNGPENKYRGQVRWLFFNSDTCAELIFDWLQGQPKDLKDIILRIFDGEMAQRLGLKSWRWVQEFIEMEKQNDEISWGGRLGMAQSELISEHDEYCQIQNDTPQLYNYANAQKKRILGRQILGFLASRNVLPKYGFPVDVVQLKLQSKDDWAQRVELDRDLKIALAEYAPGCTLVANGKVIKSYALEKVIGKAWPEYNFVICKACGQFYRSETSQDTCDDTCKCGQSLTDRASVLLKGSFVEPTFGFRTQIQDNGKDPVEVRPERTYPTRVYFSHYRISLDAEPFIPEGDPDYRLGIKIEKRYSRNGVLAVINGAGNNRGFWICPSCGFGVQVINEMPLSHKTPWGKSCKGRLRHLYLGHEFHTDVLEIRFIGGKTGAYEQGFWLSVTAALLSGAAKALDIERSDIDGTVLRFGGHGHRSIVLYDTVPGGAGHVKMVAAHFERVLEAAYNIAENCTGCSRDQSCSACLRTFNNQFAHDLLARGPVADFIAKVVSGLYRKNANGYFALGLTDKRRWFLNQIRRSQRLYLVLDDLPEFSGEVSSEKEWFNLLYELTQMETEIHLCFHTDLKKYRMNPLGKVGLRKLELLCGLPHMSIYNTTAKINFPANLCTETPDNSFAARWQKGENPFTYLNDIEISVLPDYLDRVKKQFDTIFQKQQTKLINPTELSSLLEGTKVIHVKKDQRQTWDDILMPHLPNQIKDVHIYDRFIRMPYQFKCLELLLEMFDRLSDPQGLKIKITTSADADKRLGVKSKFKRLQQKFKQYNPQYDIRDAIEDLPHYREIKIKSRQGDYSLWLDKGVQIFWFDKMTSGQYTTVDTYIVVEKK